MSFLFENDQFRRSPSQPAPIPGVFFAPNRRETVSDLWKTSGRPPGLEVAPCTSDYAHSVSTIKQGGNSCRQLIWFSTDAGPNIVSGPGREEECVSV